ncbi:hypothetical protein [uncultured Variovorax sp.]|uniref:hypothetical protein n=1 Tax=uncultured Variovorax sp. TaxID=114708 RepID=UPI00262B6190|nr:hypothetical protein [uncultured Variovorax sp.]
MEPARTIIELLGGEAEVARIAGVAITAPYRWQAAKAKGGTGGMVPHWHIGKLLEHAAANGIELTAASFAPVFPVAQPEQAA